MSRSNSGCAIGPGVTVHNGAYVASRAANVEGISLVLTYRSEFEQITRASGIDGPIQRLREKNA